MAIRNDFAPGEVLAAADLNDTFGSKLPFSFGTATPTTTTSGFLWYDSNSTPAAPKFWTGSAFQALTSGKILQVVRDTDTTQRTTTSTSYVDVTGMSVTITPQKSDSAILLIAAVGVANSAQAFTDIQITDNSNNAVSGGEAARVGSIANAQSFVTLFGYSTPATTSATTYKLRFKVSSGTGFITNNETTGQLYAIEVSA
jgi:hypothetical protein